MSRKRLSLKIKKPMKESSLPTFPHFAYLQPEHQAQLNNITKLAHPYSDYNFISLWSWDHQNRLKLCTLNDNLVVRFQDYGDPDDFFYSFFGLNQTDDTAHTLLAHSLTKGKTELKLIPELVIENLKQPFDFVIGEDRDNFDYIVAVKDMVELSASPKKRWSMNQFLKKHSDNFSVSELDIRGSRHNRQMMHVVDAWQKQMSSHDSYSSSEIEAIKKMLNQHPSVKTDNLHIIGVYLGDELKGFSISEILDNGFAIGHYKKTDRAYRGLGVSLEHHTAKSLQAKGVSLINQEQDLGLEGLRQAKLAHHPVYFLKKYTMALKSGA
jgi:hypothetical protein